MLSIMPSPQRSSIWMLRPETQPSFSKLLQELRVGGLRGRIARNSNEHDKSARLS